MTNWVKPIRGVELFESREFEANDLRNEYDDACLHWENDGYPVGSNVPRSPRTSAVASFPIAVGEVDWELRLSRVEPLGDELFAWAPVGHASLRT